MVLLLTMTVFQVGGICGGESVSSERPPGEGGFGAPQFALAPDTSPSAAPTPTNPPLPVNTPTGSPIEVFKVANDLGVQNGGTPTQFTTSRAYYVTELTTYHWNGGAGAAAGTIALRAADGRSFGPWQATLVNGVYWRATPNVTVPSGSYTVIDADPATWAQNAGTNGQGMAWMLGIPTP